MTATENEPGAHDGSASLTTFSVVVRSYAREVLLAPAWLKLETRSRRARISEDFAKFTRDFIHRSWVRYFVIRVD